jgi:predicted GNAT superfamily acetyltransferase
MYPPDEVLMEGNQIVTYDIRMLETPQEMEAVVELQRLVWPGDELEILPVHMLQAAVHNGGLVIGAYSRDRLVGFVFGFPGFETTPQGLRLIHASHLAGVHPEFRDAGLGFRLKRAQWQLARRQGVERITWTYDPLQSRNANLNITKLGAVCNTYIPNYYGQMGDALNAGVPSDRFQVDWWVNSHRVRRRLGVNPPGKLDLAHYLGASTPFVNRTSLNAAGFALPQASDATPADAPLLLLEIPADVQAIRAVDLELAIAWSQHVRDLFLELFDQGYLVTDFVHLSGPSPRSFYVLSDGTATL